MSFKREKPMISFKQNFPTGRFPINLRLSFSPYPEFPPTATMIPDASLEKNVNFADTKANLHEYKYIVMIGGYFIHGHISDIFLGIEVTGFFLLVWM